MSAPLILIVFPGVVATGFFFLQRWEKAVAISGTIFALLLSWFAWMAPIGETLQMGPWSLEIAETLTVLGRRFVLEASDRPMLVLVYLGVAFWFGGSIVAHTGRLFVPLGLGITSLLTAALAVEPFLYAALLIEMAALVCVPILSSPGKSVGRGVVRFLTYQTLGMPFILFTGWILAGLEATPGDSNQVLHAGFLMSMGFAFLLGVFPFHTWIPMLAEEGHPYAVSFVFIVLPLVISLFGLGFLDRYSWMRSSQGVYALLRFTGSLMVVTGGLWAAFQRHLGRMMGYAVMVEIGLSLLVVGAGTDAEGRLPLLGIFFAMLLPRGLSLGVWALALATIQSHSGELNYRAVQGFARKLPIAAGSLLLAHFSLAGFPTLAGFPVRLALWEGLAQEFPIVSLTALLGSVGLLIGGIRTLSVLVMGSDEEGWRVSETWDQSLLLVITGIALVIVGLLPQWFLPVFTQMSATFVHLAP